MSQTLQWLNDWVPIISNLTLAIAAIFGIAGLWQWRSELVGKTKFEAARKMMLLALQFRDEYNRARIAWTFIEESANRKKNDDEIATESFILNEHYARWQRLQPLQETLRKLHEIGWEAEVLLSDNDAQIVFMFEKIYQDLYLAMESLFDFQLEQAKNPMRHVKDDEDKKIKNYRSIIYGVRGDEVSIAMDEAANKVKRQLKKYIR